MRRAIDRLLAHAQAQDPVAPEAIDTFLSAHSFPLIEEGQAAVERARHMLDDAVDILAD